MLFSYQSVPLPKFQLGIPTLTVGWGGAKYWFSYLETLAIVFLIIVIIITQLGNGIYNSNDVNSLTILKCYISTTHSLLSLCLFSNQLIFRIANSFKRLSVQTLIARFWKGGGSNTNRTIMLWLLLSLLVAKFCSSRQLKFPLNWDSIMTMRLPDPNQNDPTRTDPNRNSSNLQCHWPKTLYITTLDKNMIID